MIINDRVYFDDRLTVADRIAIHNGQAKQDANLKRLLRLVINDPFALGKRSIEMLLINDLIEFGGPSDSCPYNHHRLTERGKATLAQL